MRGSKKALLPLIIIALLLVLAVSLFVVPTSATVSSPEEPQSQPNLIGSTLSKEKEIKFPKDSDDLKIYEITPKDNDNVKVHEITLITGDVVTVFVTPDGRENFAIESADPTKLEQHFQISQIDNQTYVVPSDVDLRKLDMEFFNIDYLIEEGYDELPNLPILITYKPGSSRLKVQTIEKSVKAIARSVEPHPRFSMMAARLPTEDIKNSYESLMNQDIEKIWLDRKVHVTLSESVPLIGAPALWENGYDGTGIKIAILDTGIDNTHPALDDLDDNENTYDPKVIAQVDFTDDPEYGYEYAKDYYGHGTHVAGIAAATRQENIGLPISGESRTVVDESYPTPIYPKLRIVVDDTERNDEIYYEYDFTLITDENVEYTVSGRSDSVIGNIIDDILFYDDDNDGILDLFKSIYLYAYSSDDDTLSVMVEAWNGATWILLYGFTSGAYGAGVAPGAYLWNVKVLNRGGWGSWSWVISGIEYATYGPDNLPNTGDEADIISMSLGDGGTDGTDPLSIACDTAVDQGIVVVVAAGNDRNYFTINTPGVARKVITVGASDKQDRLAYLSSKGPTIDFRVKPDVLAPGVSIISCVPYELYGTYYQSKNGTSMSTPHVAGAAALMLQIGVPSGWSAPEYVKDTMISTALDLGKPIMGGSRVVVDESYPDPVYSKIRISMEDTEGNDVIYYGYGFTLVTEENDNYTISGQSDNTSTPITDILSYDNDNDGVLDKFASIYLYAFSGDNDTLNVLVEAHDGITWSVIYGSSYNAYEQGGGRIDIARAAATKILVTPATISFGTYLENTSDNAMLTFYNLDDVGHTLDLSVSVVDIFEPESRPIASLSENSIVVPAGENVSVVLTINTAVPASTYSGKVVATIDNDLTSIHAIFGFARLPAMLTPPHSDYGLDTDNDNFYNYLVVEARVTVDTPGWYRISSDLYDNAGYYITYAWAENYLETGTQTLELRFEGLKIYQSKRDGPYRVNMSLYDDEYNRLDWDEHETAAYTYYQFQPPPPPRFAPPHSDYGLDTDNDNLYNYLVVEARVTVDTPGWYRISSSLYSDYYYIADAWAESYLENGTQTLELYFKGLRIHQSERDGPYRANMSLYDDEYNRHDWDEHETAAYTYDQFQPPPARFAPPHSDYGLDTDNDNLYNYLVVEARVTVDTPGWYRISSSLYSDYYYIADAMAESYLENGTQTLELYFKGLKIHQSERDGPYRANMSLYDDEHNQLDSDEHETQPYTYENFQYLAKFSPPHSDYGLDTDNDSLYNYLVVEVNVSVTTAGTYRISSSLRDNTGYWITSAWAENYLDVGTQTLELRFEGLEIYPSERDGPYRVYMSLYDDEYNWLDSDEHETAPYTYDQFQPPPARFTPPHSDYGLDTDNDNLFNYLVVEVKVHVEEAGEYEVSGDLWDSGWNWIDWEWTERYLDAGIQTLEFRFSGYAINNSEADGPYRVDLRLYDEEGNLLDSDEHWTAAYTYDQFQPLPAKFTPPHLDYGLDMDNDNLYNYLVVEVKMEVTTPGRYRVYGYLYDYAYNWITYTWIENYLDVGTQTLEFRFKGWEIRQSERDGPYRVYLDLYDDEYNWLDGVQHITAAYSYTQFQTPPLMISPTDDAQVLQGDPNGNYGSRTYLHVGRYLDGAERAFLKFDISDIPEGSAIIEARYYNYLWNVGYGGANVQVQAVENDAWTEDTITWNNQPTPGAILDGPYRADSWYQWYSWDITDFVAEQYAGDKVVSISMVDTGENSGTQFSGFESKEWSYERPYLEVTYQRLPYALNISISPDSRGGLPGKTLSYVATVTNMGLNDDTYELTVEDIAGWNPTISPTSISVQSGQAENVMLTVTILENAVPYAVDVLTVTATSQTDNTVSDSAEAEAHVAGPGAWFAASFSPNIANYGVAVRGAGENIYIANSSYIYPYPNYLMRYNTTTDTWSELSTSEWFKNGSYLEWDNGNYIYAVFGGSYNDCRFNRRYYFQRYNISSGSWETLSDTPWFTGPGDALTWVRLGDNEYIYALLGSSSRSASPGGYYEGDYYPEGVQFWRYNIATDEWDENLTPTPYGADDGADLVWTGGDYIYAFVGAYDEGLPKDNERFFLRYSISTDRWEEMEKTPYNAEGGVDDGGSLVYLGYGDYIYALKGGNDPGGGSIPGDNFWRYSISNDNWEILSGIPAGVGDQNGHRLGLAGGAIYCWRGSYGDGTLWAYFIMEADVSISPGYQSGPPGATLNYTVTVTNIGTVEDTYNLSARDMGWYNLSWSHRRPITIENPGDALENYQVKIFVPYDNDMLENFGDLRFINNDQKTELPYWIENYSLAGDAIVWVKVPTLPENDSKTIWVYYGNASATSESSGEATFDFFDDFSGDLSKWKDLNEWTVPPGRAGEWTIENGELSCESWEWGDGRAYIMTGDKSWRNYEYSVDIKGISRAINGDFGVLVRWDGLPWIDPVNGLATENNAYRGTIRIGTSTWFDDYIGKLENGVGYNLAWKTSPSRSLNTWYNVKMRVYENVLRLLVDDTEILSAIDSTHTSGLVGNWLYTLQHGHFDNARVRKYIEPEPTTSMGEEDSYSGWSPSISPTSLTLAPGASQNATLRVTIPKKTAQYTEDNIIVTATSQAVIKIESSATCTAHVIGREWDALITATFSEGIDDAVFGIRLDATAGFDNAYDLPEPPPPIEPPYVQAFFHYPGNKPLPSRLHISCIPPGDIMEWPLRVSYSNGTDNITLSWNLENVPADYAVLLFKGEDLVADMRAVDNYTFEAASGEHDFKVIAGEVVPFTLELTQGWNMISFPVLPGNSSPDAIFGGYYVLYRWDEENRRYVLHADSGSFIEPDPDVEAGVGYWTYVLENENVNLLGVPVNRLTLSLYQGWNLIGPPYGGSSIADPADNPDNSVLSYAFTWNARKKSYSMTQLLEAGKGYWVYALRDCTLTLLPSKVAPSSAILTITAENTSPTASHRKRLEPSRRISMEAKEEEK